MFAEDCRPDGERVQRLVRTAYGSIGNVDEIAPQNLAWTGIYGGETSDVSSVFNGDIGSAERKTSRADRTQRTPKLARLFVVPRVERRYADMAREPLAESGSYVVERRNNVSHVDRRSRNTVGPRVPTNLGIAILWKESDLVVVEERPNHVRK
jgi:hypothetical protein